MPLLAATPDELRVGITFKSMDKAGVCVFSKLKNRLLKEKKEKNKEAKQQTNKTTNKETERVFLSK